jgi:ActR/RegA family two-component response regulator
MSADYSYLPGVLAEIAEIASLKAALAVAEVKGGARVYIPARAPDNHWLTKCVGRAAADKICKHFANDERGMEILIPLGPTAGWGAVRRRIYALLDEGRNAADIARRLKIHERTVRRHRKKHKTALQSDLFGS